MIKPKISVIVPVYKVEKYIEKCVCSLMEQTLDDIEYIFVDDCSPDNSIKILETTLERYPHRVANVRIIHHDVNKGLTSARNSGLAVARGKYIAHCDSDDWVESTMYEELYNKAVKENADIVYSNIRMIYKGSEKLYKAAEFSEGKQQLMRNYISTVWTVIWNMIVKKEMYLTEKLKSPTHLSYCEDFWLSVRLFHFARKIAYVNKAFYNYNRMNETSIVHTLNRKTEKEEQTAYLETIDFFEKEGVIRDYERELSWRILKSKQELVLDKARHKEFCDIYPTSHKYIFGCPYINKKLKVMMWCLTHHCRFVVLLFVKLRNILNR